MKRLQVLNLLTKFILGNPKSLNSAQNDDSSSIRRAISLSDLSMGKGKMLFVISKKNSYFLLTLFCLPMMLHFECSIFISIKFYIFYLFKKNEFCY